MIVGISRARSQARIRRSPRDRALVVLPHGQRVSNISRASDVSIITALVPVSDSMDHLPESFPLVHPDRSGAFGSFGFRGLRGSRLDGSIGSRRSPGRFGSFGFPMSVHLLVSALVVELAAVPDPVDPADPAVPRRFPAGPGKSCIRSVRRRHPEAPDLARWAVSPVEGYVRSPGRSFDSEAGRPGNP